MVELCMEVDLLLAEINTLPVVEKMKNFTGGDQKILKDIKDGVFWNIKFIDQLVLCFIYTILVT